MLEIARREQVEDALQVADAKLFMISEPQAKRWRLSAFIGKGLCRK
jgi:hypothetical protein